MCQRNTKEPTKAASGLLNKYVTTRELLQENEKQKTLLVVLNH